MRSATGRGSPSSTTRAWSSRTWTPRPPGPACASRASTPRCATTPTWSRAGCTAPSRSTEPSSPRCTPRFAPAGRSCTCPEESKVELPLQTFTYVDRDGLAVFPHTVLVAEEGAEVTYVDRYASPDLDGVLSNAVVEIYAGPGSQGPLRRAPGMGERRHPPVGPARRRRPRRRRAHAGGGVRREPLPDGGREPAGGRRGLERDARRVLRRRRPALRLPLDPGSRGQQHEVRPAVQGRA